MGLTLSKYGRLKVSHGEIAILPRGFCFVKPYSLFSSPHRTHIDPHRISRDPRHACCGPCCARRGPHAVFTAQSLLVALLLLSCLSRHDALVLPRHVIALASRGTSLTLTVSCHRSCSCLSLCRSLTCGQGSTIEVAYQCGKEIWESYRMRNKQLD
ncbi:hypothetical protein VNO78_07689 [Psophocarpus tetragonolobus]|uniref:Uncharacterized protein n=1 Tax=Psophocarpus tetragonolobus TaxID=3891 RepID=A0AAN9XRW9_PSOTE